MRNIEYLFDIRHEVTGILNEHRKLTIKWIIMLSMLLLLAFFLIVVRNRMFEIVFIISFCGACIMISMAFMGAVRNAKAARKCSHYIEQLSSEIRERLK